MSNAGLFTVKSLLIALLGTLYSCTNANNERAKEKKPNIIIIYTDDVGYGDVSSYGATRVETPNIDQLALNGLLLPSTSDRDSYRLC